MRALRILLAFGVVTILCPMGVSAVDGVNEINQTSILATTGFPYTIPASGSYVLTGNLTPPPGVGALVAGADNIEIDLDGFAIISPGGGGGPGIDSAGFTGLTVRHGVVQGFSGSAISAGTRSKVIETKLSGNGSGIVGAIDCLIVMNRIVDNLVGPGVDAQHCKIENNVIANNSVGISGGANVIVHNTIRGNLAGGVFEFGASTIQENMIIANTSFGISNGFAGAAPPPPPPPAAPGRTNIIGNTISDTLAGPPVGGRGISFGTPILANENTVSGNFGTGIICGPGCVVNRNAVNNNNLGGAVGGGGVTVGDGSAVSGNSISYNTGVGLTLPAAANASYTQNTMIGNVPGPQVASPATFTGPGAGGGNVCVGGIVGGCP